MARWIGVTLAVLVLGSAWLWWTRPPATAAATTASGAGVGLPAPDFTLPTLDGGTFTLSEQRGKPVVLNFWATWCIPCQRELPALQRAAAQHQGAVVFAGVDQGETIEAVQRFLGDMDVTFTIPLDGQGDVGSQYNVKGLPTTYFIDADGVIRSVWMGEMNAIVLAEQIAKIWP